MSGGDFESASVNVSDRSILPRGFLTATRLSPNRDLDVVVTVEIVNDGRDQPAPKENADNEIAERAEVLVQCTDQLPEATFEAELVSEQAKRLDAADQKRDDDRHQRDCQVVIQLAH